MSVNDVLERMLNLADSVTKQMVEERGYERETDVITADTWMGLFRRGETFAVGLVPPFQQPVMFHVGHAQIGVDVEAWRALFETLRED